MEKKFSLKEIEEAMKRANFLLTRDNPTKSLMPRDESRFRQILRDKMIKVTVDLLNDTPNSLTVHMEDLPKLEWRPRE